MILSDNETRIDMLNNRAIAKTIVEVIRDCDDRPISIGVHGDWGAGKSSILAMVEDEFTKTDDGYVCIRFNGWKHQGFEDSKIALMSAIVSELSKNRKLTDKAKDALKKLWKNINWLSVAKKVGSSVFAIATGLPPIGLLSNVLDTLKGAVSSEEKVAATLDSIGKYMTDSNVFEDTSLSKEFTEFQKSFETLLHESKIKKLVVLIDDLDRCLPKVTIETLEAVRLFMFTQSTAFVIAADEAMIEYAVYNHFPNLSQEESKNEYDYAKRYLEKLIQVPFKIPALGEVESEMYVTLLMICSVIKEDDTEFNSLLVAAIEKMKRPWENTGLTIDNLRTALRTKYDSVNSHVSVAHQISGILASNTQGNPRKIKRFLNMLLLRKQMAAARGFGDDVQIPILAKLMLAEYYFPIQYKEIAALSDDSGICPELSIFERQLMESSATEVDGTPVEEENSKLISRSAAATEKSKKDKHLEEWKKNKSFSNWVVSEPKLGGTDLRPYFFASKGQEDFFFNQIKSEQLRELISQLMGESMNVANATESIKKLTFDEAKQVFTLLKIRIRKASSIETMPKGIIGVRALVAHHNGLENLLIGLIESFDSKTVGAWICTGWNDCIKSESAKAKFKAYINKLANDGTRLTKAAATTLQ